MNSNAMGSTSLVPREQSEVTAHLRGHPPRVGRKLMEPSLGPGDGRWPRVAWGIKDVSSCARALLQARHLVTGLGE